MTVWIIPGSLFVQVTVVPTGTVRTFAEWSAGSSGLASCGDVPKSYSPPMEPKNSMMR